MKTKRKGWIWIAAGLLTAVLVLLLALPRSEKEIKTGNLLLNGDFSRLDGNGLPENWYTDDYMRTAGYTDYAAKQGEATIVNHGLNDARFAQSVAVEPDSIYCLRGEIRANAQGGLGGNLSVEGVYAFSPSVYDSQNDWQEVCLYGYTGKDQSQVTVFARLGGYSGESIGTASFRNISLEQIASVPDGEFAAVWYTSSADAEDVFYGASPAWPWLVLVACLYGALCWVMRGKALDEGPAARPQKREWRKAALLLAAAFAVRVVAAAVIHGYEVDINCFSSWGGMLANVGPADFYNVVGFCDYPPGYILILGLLAKIGGWLGAGMTEMLVKIPSILCDVIAAGVLYGFVRKRASKTAAITIALLYALNPLTFAAGAAWGQADSVMSLFLLLTVICALENKWAAALPLYMLSVLMKPQALMFGPLGLLALLYTLVVKKEKKLYIRAAIGLALAAATAVCIILPFSPNMDNSEGWWIIRLYQQTMGYYANVTVNACNLYFLFDLNWISVENPAVWYLRLLAAGLLTGGVFAAGLKGVWWRKNAVGKAALCLCPLLTAAMALIPMDYNTLGTAVIVLSVLICAALYLKGRDARHLPLLGAAQLILLCCLGVMMHERYLFAAVALLALACVLERDWRVYLLFAALTICAFLNVGVVLDRGVRIGGVDGHLNAPAFSIFSDSALLEYGISALLCAVTAFTGYTVTRICVDGSRETLRKAVQQPETAESEMPDPAVRELTGGPACPVPKLSAPDWLLMLGITGVYAVVSLTNLGSTVSPQTWWRSKQAGEAVVLDLGETRAFEMLYLGGIHSRNQEFTVSTSNDGETWGEPEWAEIQEGQCFQWQYVRDSYSIDGTHGYNTTPRTMTGRYVRIEAQSIATTVYEVILRDPQTKETYPVTLLSGNGQNLIDEQDTFTGEPSWYNSTYFDEIYHARTGYEHYLAMHGDMTYMPYETSHPPLGKLLIAFSIGIFGMTPFGWRFAGAMAGILMLPGVYLLGRLLTRRRLTAFLAMFLMAVDFMHFTQTRIATIDSFVVLFIIWSYVFMVYYVRMDYWRAPLRRTLIPLALSGLFMGLSVASKWTGCYAGMGLAVLLFWTMYRRFRQSRTASRFPEAERAATAEKEMWLRPLVTLASCLVFFVAVPLAIYYVSYIPYFLPYQPSGITVKRVIQAAVGDWLYGGPKGGMLGYHSTPGLGMDHFFYSPWYEWPVMAKPMWYYAGTYVEKGLKQTIMAFGNPIVWWGGLAALLGVALVWMLRHVRRDGVTLHTRQNDVRPAVILISFLAQYLPWMLVPRGTYIYHYFPSVPFIILSVALCVDLLADAVQNTDRLALREEWAERFRWLQHMPTMLSAALMALSLAMFVAFFPYISGVAASPAWLKALQWFEGWIYF